MRRNPNSPSTSTAEPETEPAATTTSGEVDWIAADEQSTEGEFSFVDPLFYAPLLLVGAALVVFPEPATTLVGLVCLAAGVTLLAVDIAS
ncbi:MAG: hypothetical protein U9O06_05820 [Euryarchaeota archaeon]|nr:hypothetical protein [Euryarchaeota archaeon]